MSGCQCVSVQAPVSDTNVEMFRTGPDSLSGPVCGHQAPLNSYATGTVWGGGLVGVLHYGDISCSYSACRISGRGGLVGWYSGYDGHNAEPPVITDQCFWDGEVAG